MKFKTHKREETVLLGDSRILSNAMISGIMPLYAALIFAVCFFISSSNTWLSSNSANYTAELEMSLISQGDRLLIKTSSGFEGYWALDERPDFTSLQKHLEAVSLKENVASALTQNGKANTFLIHLKVSPTLRFESFKDILPEIQRLHNHQYKISLLAYGDLVSQANPGGHIGIVPDQLGSR